MPIVAISYLGFVRRSQAEIDPIKFQHVFTFLRLFSTAIRVTC